MHELGKLTLLIEKQVKEHNQVNIIIDKDTIDRIRKSMRVENLKGTALAGGIDKKIKNFGIKNYTIREDANWIKAYVKRNIKVDHKLKFFVGGTEIHIVSDPENW